MRRWPTNASATADREDEEKRNRGVVRAVLRLALAPPFGVRRPIPLRDARRAPEGLARGVSEVLRVAVELRVHVWRQQHSLVVKVHPCG